MGRLARWLGALFYKKDPDKAHLIGYLRVILGIRPMNLALYDLALTHSSVSQDKDSNERLEFLGDAVLSLVVAEYLFKRYPLKQEGFLTEIRSRLVNRASLNTLAQKMQVHKVLRYDSKLIRGLGYRSIYGNALEALIGAIYLDQGYQGSKQFIVDHIMGHYVNLDDLIAHDDNFKGQILHWAQKNHRELAFTCKQEAASAGYKVFTVHLMDGQDLLGIGAARSKKDAEQLAAKDALDHIQGKESL